MSDSPSEIAELKAEVAALSTVVAALFATNGNMSHIGDADRLAFYASAIANAGQANPSRVAAIVNRVAQQATVGTDVFRESRR